MSCDVGEVKERLENEQSSLLPFSRAHSPTFSSLHLRHNSFSNPSVALPTSQLILQPFRFFTYVTVHSPTFLSLLLRQKLFTQFTWRAAHGVYSDFYSFDDACVVFVIKHVEEYIDRGLNTRSKVTLLVLAWRSLGCDIES